MSLPNWKIYGKIGKILLRSAHHGCAAKKIHQSENTFFAKNKRRKGKHKQSVVNFFQENTTL